MGAESTNGIRERVDAHERRINDHEKRMRKLESNSAETRASKNTMLLAFTMFAVYLTLAMGVYAVLKN